MPLTPTERSQLLEEKNRLRREFWKISGDGPDVDAKKQALRTRHLEIEEQLRATDSLEEDLDQDGEESVVDVETETRQEMESETDQDVVSATKQGVESATEPQTGEESEPETEPEAEPQQDSLPEVSREPIDDALDTETRPALRSRKKWVWAGILLASTAVLAFPLVPYLREIVAHERPISSEPAPTEPIKEDVETSRTAVPITETVTVSPLSDEPSTAVSLPWNKTNLDVNTNGNVELAARFLDQVLRTDGTIQGVGIPVHDVARNLTMYYGRFITLAGKVNFVFKQKRRLYDRSGQQRYLTELNLIDSDEGTPIFLYIPEEIKEPVEGDIVQADALPVGRTVIANLSNTTITRPVFVGVPRKIDVTKRQFMARTIGEIVKQRDLQFRVTDFWESNHLDAKQSHSDAHYAESGRKFVVVHIAVLNTSDSEFDFSPDYGGVQAKDCRLRLMDENGTEYLTYSDSILYLNNCLSYQSLKPDTWEDGYLAYDVPETAGSFRLLFNDGTVVFMKDAD